MGDCVNYYFEQGLLSERSACFKHLFFYFSILEIYMSCLFGMKRKEEENKKWHNKYSQADVIYICRNRFQKKIEFYFCFIHLKFNLNVGENQIVMVFFWFFFSPIFKLL